jgi:hypothetical protein
VSEPRFDLDHVEVDVEPLGDPRWSRIERGMFTRLEGPADGGEVRRTGNRRGWVGAACVLAAAAAAVLVVVRPSVVLRSRDPVRLVTTSSPSRFTIGESSLWIEPSSLVLVSGDDEHGVDVVLDRGTVTCEVAPRHGRPPFVVDAGEVRVQVVGTRFTVTRGAVETSVGVDHGVVEVAVGGVVTVLRDGERWPAPPGPAVPAATQASSPVAAPVAPSEPSPVLSPESPAAVDAPAVATTHPLAPGRRAAPPGSVPPGSAPSAAPQVTVAESAAPAPAPSPQVQFETAAKIERTRPDDAEALYRQLVSGGTGWSASALFALGRLEADRGRRADAVRLLQEYVARYPRGINVDDARALLNQMR